MGKDNKKKQNDIFKDFDREGAILVYKPPVIKVPEELSALKKYLQQLTAKELMKKKNKKALEDYKMRTGNFLNKGGSVKTYSKGGGVRKPKMTAGY